uniref:ATP synthase complex subunit 8 n=1 Tax=Aspidiphorus orbiculatus TaxID=577441 RepID=A0A0S2M6H6_9CUCU|nr:ATP synthase F0 subunit 8 [Aspidiphorus orbiculatus]
MPQMMPMNWTMLFILFTITFMVFNMFNYYYVFYTAKNINKTNTSLQQIWKW